MEKRYSNRERVKRYSNRERVKRMFKKSGAKIITQGIEDLECKNQRDRGRIDYGNE